MKIVFDFYFFLRFRRHITLHIRIYIYIDFFFFFFCRFAQCINGNKSSPIEVKHRLFRVFNARLSPNYIEIIFTWREKGKIGRTQRKFDNRNRRGRTFGKYHHRVVVSA